MSKDTGGPAFPWCGDLNECPTINLGMTLRDYFAAKAMQAFIATLNAATVKDQTILDLATSSYGLADLMLAERSKP